MEDSAPQPTGEQSWIVLDDNGWVSASRPPTASPSRRSPRPDDEDDAHAGLGIGHRLGMDRDVREALELAERSLELAGSIDEFSRLSHRTHSDDDVLTHRSSPSNRGSVTAAGSSEDVEDRYKGRAAPTVGGNRRNVLITTDSEHVAFQNFRIRTETPLSANGSVSVPELDRAFDENARMNKKPNSLAQSEPNEGCSAKNAYGGHGRPFAQVEEENEGSIMQWMLGLPGSPNFVPLALSHVVTLLIGFYVGSRRVSAASSPGSLNSSNVANSAQCTGS